MEIIHLILGKANPQRMNGVNKVVNELASRQIKSGLMASVWGITVDPVHDYPPRGYETRLFQTKKNPFLINIELQSAILGKKGKVVFHLHGGFIPTMYKVAKGLKKNKIPFIFTPHGSYNTIAMKKNSLIKKIYFNLFERSLLRSAKVIHALGASEIEGLESIFPNEKSVLIPYGFEALQIEEKEQRNPSAFIIGFCGRLDIHTKGLKELLEGFKMFSEKEPSAQLWIIGDGPEKEKLKAIANGLLLNESIVFYGAKFGKEKEDLLQQFDVFAAPSRNEGLPTAVLEAASMGIPCLVTKATNTGDYIGDFQAGLVMNQTCPIEILNGLNHLHFQIKVQSKAREFSENARKMIREAFNWEMIIDRFTEIYQ